MSELVDELVAARLPWVSPRIQSWYDDRRLASQLATHLAVEADRWENVEFGTSFRDAVGDPGLEQDPLAWANRRIWLANGGWALVGIRFRALDRDRPFVEIVATDQPATPDGLAAVADGVRPGFVDFAPRCLRVDAADPAALVAALDADDRFGRSGVDQYVVAGLVSAMLQRHTTPREVALRRGEPDVLAGRVAGIYAAHAEESRLWARPEDEESLAECAAQDLLFEVLVDDVPAGVVAAIREDAHGMSGFCVQELCLEAAYRGRGLAARAVRLLAQELPAGPGDVLWGTIHPDNTPSLRQALSLGREIVGGYVWVTPRGWPGMPLT
jgi:hypothetical protein